MKKNKNILKRFFDKGGFFVLLVIITFLFIFKNSNINEIITSIKQINPLWIMMGLILMAAFLLCQGFNIKRCLEITGTKTSYFNAFKYSLVGFFYSSITPSSTGGQPMQIYYMHKDNIKIAHSSFALLIELASFMIATNFFAILGYVFAFKEINSIGNVKYLLYAGLAINLVVLSFIFMSIFSKKFFSFVIKITVKLLKLLHIKKVDNIEKKLQETLKEYQTSSLYIKNNKLKMLRVIITSLIQIIALHSIIYLIYRGLNLNTYNYLTILSLDAFLYVAVSCVPFPGAVGVSESAFLILFKLLFPAELLSGVMILNRSLNFYIPVLVTGIIIMIIHLKTKKVN